MADHGFTPGPWQAETLSWPSHPNERPWVGRLAESRYAAFSCGKTQEEAIANARLIAASPTLLEALIRAADEIEDLRKYANNHGGMIDNERCDYARAAITLATGKDA